MRIFDPQAIYFGAMFRQFIELLDTYMISLLYQEAVVFLYHEL